MLGVAALDPLREGLSGAADLLDDLVGVPLPVLARVWVALPVARLEGDGVGSGLVPERVGVTGTHSPHVTPGNPGAPGVERFTRTHREHTTQHRS